jgi:L-aminopeptidase/D-esterase-like protein
MVCFGFKGGTGTSSRRVAEGGREWTVGVLVQANFGRRPQLVLAGVPVGKELEAPVIPDATPRQEQGSIIVVVATDAPLLPHQLRRLARRAALGLGRTGGAAGNGSGDIMLAFSTANPGAPDTEAEVVPVEMLPNSRITTLFDATIFATEEAIVNALCAGETISGLEGRRVEALPVDRVRDLLARAGRLSPP